MEEKTLMFNAGSKLKGTENWTTWKFQTRVVLQALNLFSIVDGTEMKPSDAAKATEWQNKDSRAQGVLVTRVEEKILSHLLTANTSSEIWSKLCSVFEHTSTTSIHLEQQKFYNLNFTNQSVSEFLSQVEEVRCRIKTMGEEISDKMVITKILMSLPDIYKHFVSAWESVSVEKQTIDELKSRLLIEEQRVKATEVVNALAATSSRGKFDKSKVKCHCCHKVGHFANECRYKNKTTTIKCSYCKKQGHHINNCWFTKKRENGNDKSKFNAFIGSTSTNIEQTDWCMDTGASEHMCWDEHLFTALKRCESGTVKIGDGSSLEVKGIGTVQVQSWNGQEFIDTTLSDVLYVPKLKYNLFSVCHVLDKGYRMKSDKMTCKFLDIDGNICCLANRCNKLFKMVFKMEHQSSYQSSAECHVSIKVEKLSEWHLKLVHQNNEHIKKLLRLHNIKYIDDSADKICEQCLAGKQHRMPFPLSTSRATERLELIHADLCGPMEVESIGKSKYFLLLKDDYSCYRFVYFLTHKDEVKEILKRFLTYTERELNLKVKTLRSDNGLEFVNKEVKSMLEERGIIHQRSVVYTPQQNGRAEREMRTLVQAARCMIQGLGKEFWAEATNTAAYVLNRTAKTVIDGKTPYELLYQKSVDITKFKQFGTKVAVHVPKEKRQKWDSKSRQGIFVGYGSEVKGYRIYYENNRDVEIQRDVIFLNENYKTEICERNDNVEEPVMLDMKIPNTNISDTPICEQSDQPSSSDNNELSNTRQACEYNLREKVNKPVRLQDYHTSFISMIDDEPKSYDEAITSNEAVHWKDAISKEIAALEENDTWSPLSESEVSGVGNVIECKWVFKESVVIK